VKKTSEIKEIFEFMARNSGRLTLGQTEFIMSLQKYYRKHKTLSDRQTAALFEIRKYFE